MEFVRGIHNLKSRHRGCALTIGSFDGFHRGHQSLILKLKEIGCNRGLQIMVMIFEPQPREYFLDESVRISSFRDKFAYFSDVGVDVLLCVLFNFKIALLDAYSFISDILVKQLNIRLMYVGDNFRFGAFRRGDFNYLKKVSLNFGFEVLKIDTYVDALGSRISSTAVRNALKRDALIEAEMLLGHPYSIFGRVVHGRKLGRIVGFPTLNILLKGRMLPISGVYAVKVYGICDQPLLGVANIGVCPTISKCYRQKLEVHLIDKVVSVYGYYIQVMICVKIRDERFFPSFEKLQMQIKNDIRSVRRYFNKR